MSAGGQRGIDVSGINSLRIQYPSDFVTRNRLQHAYIDYSGNTTGIRNHNYNSDQYYRQFLSGIKESCVTCSGLPFTIFK